MPPSGGSEKSDPRDMGLRPMREARDLDIVHVSRQEHYERVGGPYHVKLKCD